MKQNNEAYNNLFPLLVILSGPSGVGKDTVLIRMKQLKCPFHYVVTATTRPRRESEIDDREYHFLSREKFQEMIRQDEFIEWANVYGYYYGVPKEEMRQALREGKDIIVKVDVQGTETIKKKLPQAIAIFLKPPSMENLEQRLRGRSSESSDNMNIRLKKAKDEIQKSAFFDYVVTNYQDEVDKVISRIQDIVDDEKQKGRGNTRLIL